MTTPLPPSVPHSALEFQHALLNILEDFGAERERLADTQRATLNILDDSALEQQNSEKMQRAILNILEDFDDEKLKVAMAFRGLEREMVERKNAESGLQRKTQELERSNEDLEQFAYIASHDLQEPLRAVASFTQLLQQRYRQQLDATAMEYIDFAIQGAARMKDLIQDLLNYARLNQGRDAAKELVNMETCLQNTLKNLEVAIRDSGARITHGSLPTVPGYAQQLSHVWQNLIGNAMKFRAAVPPAVHINCRRDGNHWEFSVADNGIGIAPQHFEKIFVIFQRLHGREKYTGTGIGLSICKKVIERHGGRIWLESTPDVGSTFFFTLPVTADEVGSPVQ